MRSVNKVILVGNLTRDPQTKATQGGQSITTFGIATNREWTTTGESDRKKSTEFHEIAVWSGLGDICQKYLRKGKLVYVEGYLKTRNWEDESGQKHFRTEIVAQDMIMLQKRSDAEGHDGLEDDFVPSRDGFAATEALHQPSGAENVF